MFWQLAGQLFFGELPAAGGRRRFRAKTNNKTVNSRGILMMISPISNAKLKLRRILYFLLFCRKHVTDQADSAFLFLVLQVGEKGKTGRLQLGLNNNKQFINYKPQPPSLALL